MFDREDMLLQAVKEAESAAIHLRQYAAATLRPAYGQSNPVDEIHMDIDVELTEEGWLKITLPVMLPRREEKDSARFLTAPLLSAIRSYFGDRALPKYQTCVLVYEHIYDQRRSRRRITDHDNLELKHIQDTLERAFLTNDTAVLCSAFQCSHMGEEDKTRIWILAPEQFLDWLTRWKRYWGSTENL